MHTEQVKTGGGASPNQHAEGPRPQAEERRNVEAQRGRLARVCRDSAYGFALAAEEVRTPACQSLFLNLAREREDFAKELEQGERSALGFRLHRRWVDFLARVSRRSLAHVLAELLREENAALDAYEGALAMALDPATEHVVVRQHAAIRRAHQAVRSLCDSGRRAR